MISKTILCVDGGLFQSWAHRLVPEFNRVMYFKPWTRSFSHPNDFWTGTGYDFDRVEHFWAHVDEADIICFLDIHFPDWATHLQGMGKQVWSPFYGEELELYRGETKQVLEEVGLPVNTFQVVHGMDELRNYLQEHENQHVKIPKLRGLTETFKSENYDLIKIKLDDLEHALGGASTVQEFICEDDIEDIAEIGYDGWCILGEFPKTSIVGCEIKDCGSASVVKPYMQLPKEVRETNMKLSPVLQEYGYKGFWSTEIRKTKDNFYPIDFTCRAASPCGENIQELVENIAEIIEAGTRGEIVEPVVKNRYAVQAMISSKFAEDNWLPISIPEEIRSHFKLYNSCKIDGQEFIVPYEADDMSELGSVVATGKTIDEAIKKCREYAEQIEGYQVCVNTDALDEARVELGKVA